MPDSDLRVAVRAAEGGTRIELAGELDVATAPELRRAMDVLQITELFELDEAP